MTPSNLQTRIKLLKIFKKVAEALNCLHQHGFVHFDIKPENIAIQESESDISVKLIDAGSLTHLPTAGESVKVHGTTAYMHPGLFENPISVFGKPSIRRSIPNSVNIKQTDIYSYGVTVKRVFESLSIFPVPNFINKSYTAEEIIKTLETSIHNLEKKGGTKKSTRRRGRKRSTRR